MTTHKTKTLMLTLLILYFGIFGVLPGYALNLSEAKKLLASDGTAGDFFGISVSISEDTAVIGAIFDVDNGVRTGSTYVYVRDGAGVWSEQQKLTASDGAADDEFGFSVSVSGDTAVIGAFSDVDNGFDSGSAYVFVRDSSGVWSEQQKLNASDGAADDWFGRSVSISGDTVVIGAPVSFFSNQIKIGSAYVFVRDGSGQWSEQQKLTPSNGVGFDRFGISVSVSADTAVIGARDDDDNSTASGSAYVFVRDGAGMWSEQQKLNASDGAEFDNFGQSVSISGNTAVIGATEEDDTSSGKAYVFVRDGTGMWSEQQKLTPSDGAAGDRFGQSVSISGDAVVIGAHRDDDIGDRSGSAYVYVRNGLVWSEQQKLTASDGSAADVFGNSVSISEETVVIGAHHEDFIDLSAAYVFETSDLIIEKLINHRVRETPVTAAELLVGTRYRAEYKVTNNSPNRLYNVQIFEDDELVCNVYPLDPGESRQRYHCANSQDVLAGLNNVPAKVTAKVSGSNQKLANQTNAYYNGFGNEPGKLKVTHYVNNKNADTGASAVTANGNQAEIVFRVENTGSIKLYRINTFHDPASPVNSGWQQQCFIGTLDPGQVRYCKRTVSVTHEGLNKVFGRAQGEDANVNPTGFVNASNPTYFNVVLP